LLGQIDKILAISKDMPDVQTEIARTPIDAVRANPESKASSTTKLLSYGIGAVALVAVAGAALHGLGLFANPQAPMVAPIAPPRSADDKPAGNAEMLQGAAAYDRKDYGQAMQYFQKAADKGNSDGEYDIGWLYENSFGMPRDYRQAMQWYLKAAGQRNAAAENSIGLFYADGLGVDKDTGKALQWLQRAAADGDAGADANITRLKKTGRL
jgi:TPR repeat protein